MVYNCSDLRLTYACAECAPGKTEAPNRFAEGNTRPSAKRFDDIASHIPMRLECRTHHVSQPRVHERNVRGTLGVGYQRDDMSDFPSLRRPNSRLAGPSQELRAFLRPYRSATFLSSRGRSGGRGLFPAGARLSKRQHQRELGKSTTEHETGHDGD
jgi:hypothetical protein